MQNDTMIQRDLLCPQCAGQSVYNPAHQGLECTQCGTTRRLERADDHLAAREFPFDPEAAQASDLPVTVQTRVHHCETCGGDVVFTGPALANRCAYCDGPVVTRMADEGYATMALIPFRVPEQDAQKLAQDWVARRFAAPGDLAGEVAKARVAGIYAPFWTFDSTEAIAYWAQYKTRSGKRTHTHSTKGEMQVQFDDLLVPASPHVTPLIRDGILHEFDPRRLRPFDAGYLAGFAAERHHQSVTEGLEANAADKDLLIRNRIKRHINRSGIFNLGYKTDTSGIHYRRILLPVWILHYSYGGTPMKVVVCGLQGRSFGERPFSRWKLGGYSALITAATILFGLFWGAQGLP